MDDERLLHIEARVRALEDGFKLWGALLGPERGAALEAMVRETAEKHLMPSADASAGKHQLRAQAGLRLAEGISAWLGLFGAADRSEG